jgi:hypothetical protein
LLTLFDGVFSTGLGAGLLVEVLPWVLSVWGLGLGKAETVPLSF